MKAKRDEDDYVEWEEAPPPGTYQKCQNIIFFKILQLTIIDSNTLDIVSAFFPVIAWYLLFKPPPVSTHQVRRAFFEKRPWTPPVSKKRKKENAIIRIILTGNGIRIS